MVFRLDDRAYTLLESDTKDMRGVRMPLRERSRYDVKSRYLHCAGVISIRLTWHLYAGTVALNASQPEGRRAALAIFEKAAPGR